MRSGTRTAAVAGMVVLVSAGAAACGPGGSHPGAGGAGGSAGAGKAVLAAYTATMSTKTASFRLDETIRATNSAGAPVSVTVTGHGVADFATTAFTATLSYPSMGAITMVLVNGTMYVQVPAAARSRIPGHKPWVSVDLNKVSQARLGESFAQAASASSSNPAQALAQLSAVSSRVTPAGRATVAGTPTTEYRAQVSLNKAAAKAQAMQGPRAAQAIRQQIKALGTATLPVEVWVGAHHLVRQIHYQIPIPAISPGSPSGNGAMAVTLTFTGFGVPVHPAPPPASQTTDLTSQLLQRPKASSG